MSQPNTHTEKEIMGQPALWETVYNQLLDKEREIEAFLTPILNVPQIQIVLSGAGSSAFIGDAAQAYLQRHTGCSAKSVATTDIVTHPQLYLPERTPVLLVSFARSGNSPESLETIKLADDLCDQVYHLIITCNREGELMRYTRGHRENSFALLLPEEANDKSLAMTGSFTSMLLSVMLIFRKRRMSSAREAIDKIVVQGNLILENKGILKSIAAKDYERVVFLGSGSMLGIARESHLKLQELSDGQVICKYDSFLGFRHGPRAVTNERTLMVYLFSPDDHVYRYERDLAISIAQDPRNIDSLSIGRNKEESFHSIFSLELDLAADDELNIVPATLVGQLLGMYKSLDLGLDPDKPSKSGAISRVVEGVTIYPYPKSLQA